MPNERYILCGEASGDQATDADRPLRLTTLGKDPTVHLQCEQIGGFLCADIPAQLLDLIEIASYVYVADQGCTRGGEGVEDMGANWRRKLRFKVPVRMPSLWQRAEVNGALSEALGFLTEDEFEFEFTQFESPPDIHRYLEFRAGRPIAPPDTVMLFSGGLDSMGGAIREVVQEGRNVVLVTHMATSKLRSRHEWLQTYLRQRAVGPKPAFATISINKDKELNAEYTQRSRSFLFASLALVISQMCGLSRFRFYENGTVSLNLPISRQVVGSKATRTTHPKTLALFRTFFGILLNQTIGIDNPFLWHTKADIVSDIVKAGHGGTVKWTTSCAHTWEIDTQVPHCGRCSQCIDRRFAVLGTNESELEPAAIYRTELFANGRDPGEDRTMLASYVETAQQVATMTDRAFYGRYGEISKILRHIDMPADAVARRVFELYQRHGQQVMSVIDRRLKMDAPQIRARRPESELVRMLIEQAPRSGVINQMFAPQPDRTSSTPVVTACPDYLFERAGEGWRLRFAGREANLFGLNVGMAYLYVLLHNPDRAFDVQDLVIAVHGNKANVPLGKHEATFDATAKRAFAQKLADLETEIAQAERNGDRAALDRLQRERDRLLAEIATHKWLGRPKDLDKQRDRIRKAVCNAITRARDRILRDDRSFGTHLKKSLTLGSIATYAPVERVDWSGGRLVRQKYQVGTLGVAPSGAERLLGAPPHN